MHISDNQISYLAHVRQPEQGPWMEHRLEDHLREVANLAAHFAALFGGENWANAAGIWYDLGKYRQAFQSYIKKASGYDPEAHIEQGQGRAALRTMSLMWRYRNE